MKNRIKQLKEELFKSPDTYCTERALIVTDSYRRNKQHTPIMQRALAFKNILENISLYIRKDELLVGNLSSRLGARPLYPEFHIGITDHCKTGSVGEKVMVDEYPELSAIGEFWQENDSFHIIDKQRDSTTAWMQKELIINSAAEVNGHGHITVDFEKIMKAGLLGIKKEVSEKMKTAASDEKKEFYKSLKITTDAALAFAARYVKLLSGLIKTEENDNRRKELQELKKIMENIPAHSPQSFHEALQFVWFIYLLLHQEHNGYSISFGRLDKILYPYYKSDIQSGKLTREDALELIESFSLKVVELPIGGIKDTKTAVITLGGLDKNGKYINNEVSDLFLESIGELKMNAPAIIVRWHESAPQEFKNKVLNTLKFGTGYPGLFGDKAVIKGLIKEHNIKPEDAHEWSEVGCAEVYVTGKSRPVDAGLINLPVVLILAVNNGISIESGRSIGIETKKPDDFNNIEEVIAEYEKAYTYLLDKEIELDEAIKKTQREMRPTPFTSNLMSSCIEKGKDLLNFGEDFNVTCVGFFSIANLVDSLVAIDELVFKQKKLTLAEFLNVLKNNFEGEDELLKEIDSLPRYGNNDERADRFIKIAHDIHYRARKFILEKYKVDVSYESIPREVHIDLGFISPATFDGRKKGEPFADGISCGQGRDKKGLTSLMQSVLKNNQPRNVTNGYVFNMKFHPRMFENEKTLSKIRMGFDTFFNNEGEQIQVNCLKTEDLIEAQKHPEKYEDLIVRVAGFCAYFNTLRKELQDEIISRTIYQ